MNDKKMRVRKLLNGTWVGYQGTSVVVKFGEDETSAMTWLAQHGVAATPETVQVSKNWKWSKNTTV